jgi:aspartate/glutamate racemase
MKKVGIIGGAGPLASSLLYESVVRNCYLNGGEIPEILILNFPFTRCLTKEEEATNVDCLLGELSYCIAVLEKHGVEMGLLACNTMHLFLKMLPQSLVEFKQLPELVLEEARENNACRLLVLASQNSCRLGLYRDPEIMMVYPSEVMQRVVDKAIDNVLSGIVSAEDSLAIGRLIQQVSTETTFDGVVLGCTDLPVLHHHHPITSSCPIYDSIKNPSKRIRGFL